MKNAFVFGIMIVITAVTIHAQPAPAPDSAEISYALSLKDDFGTRQYKGVRLHRALAFTTGGLLLAADAMGIYHFLSMQQQGHDYRDKIGYSEDNGNETVRSNEIQTVWQNNQSQSERVIHGALIAASVISYVSTATIELTLPRMDNDSSRFSKPNIHRSVFYCHAALMLANIGLGFAESYALSKGEHNLVQGLGITHMVVGIAAPVVMIGSGLVFKF
jgi:hypothetical protein